MLAAIVSGSLITGWREDQAVLPGEVLVESFYRREVSTVVLDWFRREVP